MMGGKGSGRRNNYYSPPPKAYYPPAPPAPPPKPIEYQLVDLLSDDGLPEEAVEAVRVLLPFIAKCRRQAALAAEESELAAIQHDLERVMTRENLYLNALMEITGLDEGEAVGIAAMALYGHSRALPKVSPVASDGEAVPEGAVLDRLEAKAASGGHGVDLSKMTPGEIRERLLGDDSASAIEARRAETLGSVEDESAVSEAGDAQ
jgi:hypothetical protein